MVDQNFQNLIGQNLSQEENKINTSQDVQGEKNDKSALLDIDCNKCPTKEIGQNQDSSEMLNILGGAEYPDFSSTDLHKSQKKEIKKPLYKDEVQRISKVIVKASQELTNLGYEQIRLTEENKMKNLVAKNESLKVKNKALQNQLWKYEDEVKGCGCDNRCVLILWIMRDICNIIPFVCSLFGPSYDMMVSCYKYATSIKHVSIYYALLFICIGCLLLVIFIFKQQLNDVTLKLARKEDDQTAAKDENDDAVNIPKQKHNISDIKPE